MGTRPGPEGTLHVNEDGERVIRFEDVSPPSLPHDAVEITLAQVLRGEVTFGTGKKRVVMKPITLLALAELDETLGTAGLPLSATPVDQMTPRDTIKIIRILANQDADSEGFTEDEVGRLVTARNLPTIRRVLGELMSPLFVAPETSPGNATDAPTGRASSGGSPKSSGGTSARLPRSQSRSS